MRLMSAEGAEAVFSDERLLGIRQAVLRLWTGFEESPIAELNTFVYSSANYRYCSEAAWQLAVWYINQESRDAAERALPYLEMLADNPGPFVDPVAVAAFRTEALLRLKRWEEARNFCCNALSRLGGGDLTLSCANLFAYPDCRPLPVDMMDRLRLDWINSSLRETELEPLHLIDPTAGLNIDNIACPDSLPDPDSGRALVSVIMAAYNSKRVIATALRSLRAQSWRNLEIMVVDDASADDTCSVVEEFAKTDRRIKLIRSEQNHGDSYARNLALTKAKGDFVTLLDADDFAHSRKIETQAEDLLRHNDLIANRSNHMRAHFNMKLEGEACNAGLMPNFSSLMFRREPVVNKIGYWDSVRFAGDSEFYARMRFVFGQDKIRDLPTGLLGISRLSPGSLTGQVGPKRPAVIYGVRREYAEAFINWHESGARLRIEFPLKERPFAVPRMLEIEKPRHNNEVEQYDEIYVSDLRLPSDANDTLVSEIRNKAERGTKMGLMRLDWYDCNPAMMMDQKFRDIINEGSARIIAYPEEAEADKVILAFPPAIIQWRRWTPVIRAGKVIILAGLFSAQELNDSGAIAFDPEEVDRRVVELFGARGTWRPITAQFRRALEALNANIIISTEL